MTIGKPQGALGGLLLLLMLLFPACAVHKPMTEVEPPEALPETFSGGDQLPPADRWWEAFGDENLDRLVEEALAGNLTLNMAWARLDQARQLARIAGAGRYPGLDTAFSAQRQHYGGGLPPTVPPSIPETLDTFSATLSLSYQVDLWKKISNSRKAAVLDFEAGRGDLEATALTIASAVAEIWASLAAQQAGLELLEEQLEVGESFLTLVEARFGGGLSSAVEVYQQRLQVEGTRGTVPEVRMQLQLLRHQLTLLLGRQPTADLPLPGGGLPLLTDLPPAGVPAEVLRNRPDVRAAELRLFAADHRVAVAVADRFPSISISATLGGQANEFNEVLDKWFTNLAGNLLGPVFDAGRRKAEAERNRAVVRERWYQWQTALLTAYTEVEDALVRDEGLRETHHTTVLQVELAQLSLDRSRALYAQGLTDYLTVLTSLQALQNLQRAEIGTRKAIISNRIRLHLALGGAWPAELVAPEHQKTISG
jgi:NodT family efflux transporter outer membrane factor (OMF) lipoprotein